MLSKLALGGLKNRFRDYAVLFSGLVIASAVFYMFMALATNTSFLKKNSPIGFTPFIFGFGAVLLAIITLVYIVYANSFLLSMRQRDYAMFMMLGAKGRKIGQLIFLETVTVGIMATIGGIFIGMVGTLFIGKWIIAALHAPATGFSPIWVPAILWTLGFFFVLFLLSAMYNAAKLLKTPMLQLLHQAQTPNRIKQHKSSFALQIVLGVILLAIGYYSMANVPKFQLMAIPLALVTIVLGTYFLFNSVFVALISLMKRNRTFAAKQLHTFTLSQLSFRIRDYTRILSVVAMLFALALGAITVGMGFTHDIPKLASQATVYDVTVASPNAATRAEINKLQDVTAKQQYELKSDAKTVYISKAELDAHPLEIKAVDKGINAPNIKVTSQNFEKLIKLYPGAFGIFIGNNRGKQMKVADAATFAKLGNPETLTTIKVKDFNQNYDTIQKIVTLQQHQYPRLWSSNGDQKFEFYAVVNGLYSGLAFMGFFLGIAFLAMLASTLMFKILSGANYDKNRYLMLQKIGARPRVLRRSIRQEIGALFLLPGVVGIVHVLFGLQLFKTLLSEPYGHLLVPFALFIVLYGLYYLATVWIYQSIVINKNLASKS
ncbi:ABC transporter permease [Lactobacillus sp. HMSC075D02]|uniref:FtsX-like permease family protein n=1 Tax=Lacticaseibacillus rhamnosus TaxID=47715 RepID=UPI0005062FE1|nr:FtsX-like permease family protein [Lacticaseibacillus rhamnosus]KFK46606.1 ABC transporter permease [Lacticaseibacillus rhamnosus]OFP91504.1 ABC transporter permease [Lactobacillus sp. HMSC075D02]QEW12955.1 FtsX-like permease family protein [Lacticaseibacillus rhamnosus]